MAGNSDRENQGQPVDPGILARLAAGWELLRTGKMPDWFSPLKPMEVVAPDDVKGRLLDYPSGYNINTTPRQEETTSFETLRALADAYDLIRLAIETRKDQMEKLEWSIRYKDEKKKDDDRVEEAEKFFKSPDKVHTWRTWLRMLLEDLLVLDAPALYVRRTNGGDLYALEPLDGATLKVVIDGYGRRPVAPDPAYVQRIKGVPAAHYTSDELIYAPRNVRTNKIYGYSPVEQVLLTVSIGMMRQLNQRDYYSAGNVPAALVGVPESWSVDQTKQFQLYWDALMDGEFAKKRKMRFVPGEVARNIHETVQPPLKDMYDEWLARIVCYAFSLEVTPFVAQVNRSVAETNREQSLTEGLAPLQLWVKSLVDDILCRFLGASDMEFVWEEEDALDPLIQQQIHVAYVNAGILTADEVRAEMGLEPLPMIEHEPIVGADGQPMIGIDGLPMTRPKPAGGPGSVPKGASASPNSPHPAAPTKPFEGDTTKPPFEGDKPPVAKADAPTINVTVNVPEIKPPDVVVDVGGTVIHVDGNRHEVPRPE